jgi:hypothetical protein
MKYDSHGVPYVNQEELFWLLYKNPESDISRFLVSDPDQFNDSVTNLYADISKLHSYIANDTDIETFDSEQQSIWHMPDSYKSLDIAQWVINECENQEQLQRVGQELLLFQERNLFDLLRYLKYFVDIMRSNNVLWGLGRGSSVSSYVLYLIGVHKIDSLYYDLDIKEFLK